MKQNTGWRLIRNVLIKAIVLFVFLNLVFAFFYPMELFGSLSGYNLIFPGRLRFPHSDIPEKSFNITTSNLEAMFQSHEISKPKASEFRIAIMGDSSVWGFLLEPEETFTARLNEVGLQAPGGLEARFYNLGYPTLSTTKDLLLLDRTIEHQPDMILWLVTLESLVESSQLESPLLQLNSRAVRDMIEKYALETAAGDLEPRTFFDRTIIGSRVELSEWVRLQLYGFAWAATGVDHYIPASYDQRAVDLSAEMGYKGIQPGDLEADDLYLEALEAGVSAAGDIPVVIINEPIFISSGKNSDIRYNFFYPRWVYDRYRSIITKHALKSGWNYVDYWDLVPAAEFTDSAIHYSSQGNGLMMEQLAALLQSRFGFSIDGR